jgi:CheY-like chemotaxis protein
MTAVAVECFATERRGPPDDEPPVTGTRPAPVPDGLVSAKTPGESLTAVQGATPPLEIPFRRILVVDDEPDVVRVVSKRLVRLGCVVDSATDGEEALVRLIENPTGWDLVLTDQTMPRRTGEQLLVALRAAGVQIPVIVMSGYSGAVTPERMLSLGARAFLAKPFDGAQLLAALKGSAPR